MWLTKSIYNKPMNITTKPAKSWSNTGLASSTGNLFVNFQLSRLVIVTYMSIFQ